MLTMITCYINLVNLEYQDTFITQLKHYIQTIKAAYRLMFMCIVLVWCIELEVFVLYITSSQVMKLDRTCSVMSHLGQLGLQLAFTLKHRSTNTAVADQMTSGAPFEAQWRIYAWVILPPFVQIMACRLISAEPLSEPMLICC